MPLSRPYGVTRPVVGQMFHVKHWLWCRWCFGRRRPRPPARLGDLASLGTASRSPPVPSGPSGALHTGDTWCARGRRPARSPSAPRASLGASSRSPARPRHRPRAPWPDPGRWQASPCPPVPPAPSTPAAPCVLACGRPYPAATYRHRVRVQPRGIQSEPLSVDRDQHSVW